MAQQPSEDKKMDISSLPRAAINLKGLPVSRNTRLPSIRGPRDLTLGGPPKRTFMPNIPPRREKKPAASDKTATQVENVKSEKKPITPHTERGRGHGRRKANIIQTEGSIFADGLAENVASHKVKNDSYQKSDYVSSKETFVKKEFMEKDMAGISSQMDELFRDDFIDDGDDDEDIVKPIIFPAVEQVKKEVKNETAEPVTSFDPNIAKDLNFDVNRVAKFIKKEKGTEDEEKKKEVPQNELTDFFNDDVPKLLFLQFPQSGTASQKMDTDSPPNSQSKGESNTDDKASDEQNSSYTSLHSLPEGSVGKLQVLKSGKARLLINGLKFDLDSLNALNTKHDLVSVRTDSKDLIALDSVKHKLTFSPNVESLLP